MSFGITVNNLNYKDVILKFCSFRVTANISLALENYVRVYCELQWRNNGSEGFFHTVFLIDIVAGTSDEMVVQQTGHLTYFE